MKNVVSVAKTYKHRGNHRHNLAKKHWFVYYYDHDDSGELCFFTKQVNWLEALYYKAQKKHRFKYVCSDCGSVFIAIVKSFKDRVECPNCQEILEY